MLVFNNYFCKNRKSKLHFGDRVAVLNVFIYQTGESIKLFTCSVHTSKQTSARCAVQTVGGYY
jgi:hypothetical protein